VGQRRTIIGGAYLYTKYQIGMTDERMRQCYAQICEHEDLNVYWPIYTANCLCAVLRADEIWM
jgi:hypothetical protein